jgi:hypothetical protein
MTRSFARWVACGVLLGVNGAALGTRSIANPIDEGQWRIRDPVVIEFDRSAATPPGATY